MKFMLCQKCGKNNATVHIGGAGGVLNLCENCALAFLYAKTGKENQADSPNVESIELSIPGVGQVKASPVADLPAGAIPIQQIMAIIPIIQQHVAVREVPNISCDSCGCNFKEFLMKGFFSCPGCYKAFATEIRKMVSSVHGNFRYSGKIPARSYKHYKTKKLIDDLREQLEREVRKENYADAAKLRDTIRNLECESEKNN